MLNYNTNIINQLWTSSKTLEGGIFNNSPEKMKIQIEFVEKWLTKIQPKHVVEIGTNKSNFVYICLNSFPTLTIDTYDIDSECINGIQILKKLFPDAKINFYCGSSHEVLYLYPPVESEIDLFYVDGHHSYKMAANDLMIAIKMNSKYILVDDINDVGDEGGVMRAIEDCLYNSGYVLLEQTSKMDDRGMAIFCHKSNINTLL